MTGRGLAAMLERHHARRLCLALIALSADALLSGPANAQAQSRPAGAQAPLVVDPQVARTADTGAGSIGQRQTRAKPRIPIEPMARINSRIASRVQNRIRNRIDRSYAAQADTTSSFETAADVIENAGPKSRR